MDDRASAVLGRPTLQLRGVCVRAGDVPILDAVDLDLPVSGRTVVIGPNGAGKTTLLGAMHGLVPLWSGTVRGLSPSHDDARLRLSFVFQKPVMLRRSSRANIEHALALADVSAPQRRARAEAALLEVGLGYAADRAARRLSGGEQQRLAIARANALDPDCLLLDEPTSNLDPAATVAIERYLMRLVERGRGFVMSTHDLGQARRVADWVVFMHRGRVVEAGEAHRFFDAPRTATARRFLAGEWLE